MQLILFGLVLFVVFWEALLGYVRDHHYQEHFVYLWIFLGLTLWRSLEGPFRGRFGFATGRDRTGFALVFLGILLMLASDRAGSSTGMRTSLVAFLSGCAVLAVPGWSMKRCLMHGLLLLLCFGLPQSVYYPLTSQLQYGVATCVAVPAWLGLADYSVHLTEVWFPDYTLVITPDCSGLGQLLTFVAIAALGVLSSAPNRKRTIWMLILAVSLAWLSNLTRVSLFVFLVGIGFTQSIDNATWHAAIGFLVFLPFVFVLVAALLKTHLRRSATGVSVADPGRVHLAWLLAPLLGAHFFFGTVDQPELPEPAYFKALASPPKHTLEQRAPTEESDRYAYDTPWLINARFRSADGQFFDLLHYATRSTSHLCVHKIAECLNAPGQELHYEPPVVVAGKQWWRIALDRDELELNSMHLYFAFEIGGERYDDGVFTQFEAMRQRILGGSWDVRLTRVMFAGNLPAAPSDYEIEVLTWLAGQ